MAEPKKRLTSTRSGNRRSHIALQKKSLSVCSQCKSPAVPHRVCNVCGYYKGVDVLKLEEKTEAKIARRKEREKEENESTANPPSSI